MSFTHDLPLLLEMTKVWFPDPSPCFGRTSLILVDYLHSGVHGGGFSYAKSMSTPDNR